MELHQAIWNAIVENTFAAYTEHSNSVTVRGASEAADAILQIPEIKEALEAARHWSEGVELPPEPIEKMGRVYGSNPATIRVTDD